LINFIKKLLQIQDIYLGDTPHRDITYHIHMKYWPAVEQMEGITILDKGKEWDGHTSEDIIRRLYKTIFETNK